MADPALGAWLPTIAVHGPVAGNVVFDSRDEAWATFEEPQAKGLATPMLARLTNNDQLVDRHPIPELAGKDTRVIGLQLGTNDNGDVLTEFSPPGGKAPPIGAAMNAWRPGHDPGPPLVLTTSRYRGPSMAIGANGTVAAVWASEDAIDVDRVKDGRLLGQQRIPVAGGYVPNSAEVLANGAGGFTASWTLRAGPQYSDSLFDLVGVDSADAPRSRPFSEPAFTPWPAPNLVGYGGVSEAQLVSDVQGDQVLVWGERIEGSLGTEDLYVSSRRAGRPFDPPQLMGQSRFVNVNTPVAMSTRGRITIAWRSTGSKILVTGGYAGRRLSTPAPLSAVGADVTESSPLLVITSKGRAIVIWTVRRDTTESLAAAGTATIEAATSENGSTFTTPRRISIGGRNIHGCAEPSLLTPDLAGGALAEWSCTFHRHERIQEYARYRP
jgi:hypothetical protein